MRIILADDHGLVRDSLRDYLAPLGPDLDIVEAETLEGVLALAGLAHPDLILLDLHMPGMNGPASVADVHAAFPTAAIVIVSGHAEESTIRAALRNGANGYIPKASRGKSLLSALRLVLAGETYVPPSILTGSPTEVAPQAPEAIASSPAGTSDSFAALTERESAVLSLLIAGKSNKQIGLELNLQEVTVKVHLRNIYRKIKAVNRTDAVRIAITRGWSGS
jgi:DNA-binding NarL/FixJ family response regulator